MPVQTGAPSSRPRRSKSRAAVADSPSRFSWIRRRTPAAPAPSFAEASGRGGFASAGASPEQATPSDSRSADGIGRLARTGVGVELRSHVPENLEAFQRWYADEEIARLLRHDQRPLNLVQSRGYFETIIMPMSARGQCWAIHETATRRLIGTTAITDISGIGRRSSFFRIVIGEKDCWGHGYGTEATALVVREGFEHLGLHEIKLEVFQHNTRARAAYERVGFRQTGAHVEFVGPHRWELHVLEMAIRKEDLTRAATDSTT